MNYKEMGRFDNNIIEMIKNLPAMKAPAPLVERLKCRINAAEPVTIKAPINRQLLSKVRSPNYLSMVRNSIRLQNWLQVWTVGAIAAAAVILVFVITDINKRDMLVFNKPVVEKPVGEKPVAPMAKAPSAESLKRPAVPMPVPVKQQQAVNTAIREIKQELSAKQGVSQQDINSAVNSVQTMVSNGVEVEDAKKIVTYAIDGNLKGDQIVEVTKSIGGRVSAMGADETENTKAADKSATTEQGAKSKMATSLNKTGEFGFEKAAPNPFTPNGDRINDKVLFYFDNPENMEVEISMFDLKGFLIRKLSFARGEVPSWDGKNEDGRLMEGGIYIFQLKAAGTIKKGSVVLAK